MKGKSISGAMLAVLAGTTLSACVSMMAPSPQMADSLSYVRQHKGEGARRALLGSEAELADVATKAFEGANTVEREPHALFAKSTEPTISLSYGVYFSPSPISGRTDVEVLMASNWLSPAAVQKFQRDAFPDLFPLAYFTTRLQDADFDPNVKEGQLLPLSSAALNNYRGLARQLIRAGANADAAISELKDSAQRNLQYLDHPANKSSYEKANAGVEMLTALKRDAGQLDAEKRNDAAFEEALRSYQRATVKPQLPEAARRFKVQGEDAAKNKRYEDAAGLFAQALQAAPWWPEGHYNRALILGELGAFDSAILEMKRYLRLVPDAPNARAAQDKIYLWEGKP